MKRTNKEWQRVIRDVMTRPDFDTSPRGMRVLEKINGKYKVPIPAYLTLKDRKVNYAFMFAEAAWILSGSNRLDEVTKYMKNYKNFSDDGVFLRGAYGPKVVDQLGYVVDAFEKDQDSRQAVLTIWRERPGPTKDIPCTVAMQFLIREDELHSIVTMRSNDAILGFTYDVFTFSMVNFAVCLLLRQRGIQVNPGTLYVNAGSLHIYERHFEDAIEWYSRYVEDNSIEKDIDYLMGVETFPDLVLTLKELAEEYK